VHLLACLRARAKSEKQKAKREKRKAKREKREKRKARKADQGFFGALRKGFKVYLSLSI
jgi:hypothetical protein